MRDTQLALLPDGGAELVNVENDDTIWASDSDQEFAEEFPDILGEDDLEDLLEYLVKQGVLTDREADVCEIVDVSDDPDCPDDGDEYEPGEDEDEPWLDDEDDNDAIDVEVTPV